MIEHILPPGVHFGEAFNDNEVPRWFPEEEALVARAVEVRRGEFGTVRRCARMALAELGIPPSPLLPDARGAPQWPAGIVGSMTHCAGYRGAVVAWDTAFASIGIDAEPHKPLPKEVLGAVSLPEEREQLSALSTQGSVVCWDRLLFSAKEALFKVWYPLTRRELDFHEASITFTRVSAHSGTFDAKLLVSGPDVGGSRLDRLQGRWTARQGLVLTAIAVAVERTHPLAASRGAVPYE